MKEEVILFRCRVNESIFLEGHTLTRLEKGNNSGVVVKSMFERTSSIRVITEKGTIFDVPMAMIQGWVTNMVEMPTTRMPEVTDTKAKSHRV